MKKLVVKKDATAMDTQKQLADEHADKEAFEIEQLRLSQDFTAAASVKKALVSVPVRKPDRHLFIRVRPEEEFRMACGVIVLREERETYVVSQGVLPQLATEVMPVEIYTTINRMGTVSLWPIRLPGEDGRWNEWHRTAREAAERAMHKWIRIVPNMSLGANDIYEAQGQIPDPEWPDHSFADLVRIAFRGKVIEDLDHPVVQRLLGRI